MLELGLALLLATTPACAISAEQREALLAQEWETFDQTPHQGWRQYAEDLKCFAIAGELIEQYLARHPEISGKQRMIMAFHAGQMYAFKNDATGALPHFYRGFNPDEDPASSNRWNAYVRATIAFLEQDRDTLAASRAVLEARRDNRMNRINLRIVRAFDEAFGKSYAEAMQHAATLPDVESAAD